ncbi:MAG TPA: c-type cytochrome, partial [Ilumatobacter sp.]
MSRGWSGAGCAAVPFVAIAIAALAGCGGDSGGDSGAVSLSPQAEHGRDVARTSGCSACHGSNGEGGVGPPLAGLYGSQVALADGSTALADDAYLTEAIREPDATRRAGYDVDMPS